MICKHCKQPMHKAQNGLYFHDNGMMSCSPGVCAEPAEPERGNQPQDTITHDASCAISTTAGECNCSHHDEWIAKYFPASSKDGVAAEAEWSKHVCRHPDCEKVRQQLQDAERLVAIYKLPLRPALEAAMDLKDGWKDRAEAAERERNEAVSYLANYKIGMENRIEISSKAAETRIREMREALTLLTNVIRTANSEKRWSANMKIAIIKADAALLSGQKEKPE